MRVSEPCVSGYVYITKGDVFKRLCWQQQATWIRQEKNLKLEDYLRASSSDQQVKRESWQGIKEEELSPRTISKKKSQDG